MEYARDPRPSVVSNYRGPVPEACCCVRVNTQGDVFPWRLRDRIILPIVLSPAGDLLSRKENGLQKQQFENPEGSGAGKQRFTRVVQPYLPEAYALARSITGNRSDAEDVVQEACLRALRALDSTAVIGNPRAWMLTIVHHTAFTWLGKNRPPGVVTVEDLTMIPSTDSTGADSDTPEASVIADAESAAVQAAIDALPAPFREAIILREVEGLSYREIAEVTGMPIGTVMSRLTRARARLVALLAKSAP
jgi:RNA polymerase sigma factor (sigma-70 family)